jgi:hypothetical protein
MDQINQSGIIPKNDLEFSVSEVQILQENLELLDDNSNNLMSKIGEKTVMENTSPRIKGLTVGNPVL